MEAIGQVSLPFNTGIKIPEGDPVIKLSEICDELDYSELYAQYIRHWRKVSPVTMFKLLVYGYIRHIYSGRGIEEACRRDICFMWLLGNEPVPDNSTISRFQDERLTPAIEGLFYQLVAKLLEIGELKFEHLFVDGTKIEANANRYTFVWEKAVRKNIGKLNTKLDNMARLLTERYILPDRLTAEQCYEHLNAMEAMLGLKKVYGKGHHKTQLQRDIEQLAEALDKRDMYHEHLGLLGGRRSFSKTDTDATFMRMKEDHMRNGQLKPGYNIQVGVENEYIVGLGIFPNPNDVNTLIPFLERLNKATGRRISKIVADAGYESEENYTYLEEKEQQYFIKPQNYEQNKKRKKNKYHYTQLPYDEETDTFICPDGRQIRFADESHESSPNGYTLTNRIYRTESCEGCPHRNQCHKSRKGYREITVSLEFMRQRKTSLENITSAEGIQLRMNRSIQVEGTFGVLKEDFKFRRFLTRGKEKTETQFFILAFAFNILKLCNRESANRLGSGLFPLKTAA